MVVSERPLDYLGAKQCMIRYVSCEGGHILTFGIAYTNDPKAEEAAVSALDVVRNRSRFGPLSVSWMWMLVCGALGSGNETSIGACDASPFVNLVAIARIGVWL
jgi:hypothetical protein